MFNPYIIDTESGTIISADSARLVYLSQPEAEALIEEGDSVIIDFAKNFGIRVKF